MLKVGDMVTIKSREDLEREGECHGLKLEKPFWIIEDNEALLIGNDGIILLPSEMNYMGQQGVIEVYNNDTSFVEINGENDYLATEEGRPLAIRMRDGYLLRLIPEFMIREVPTVNPMDDMEQLKARVSELEQEIKQIKAYLNTTVLY